MHACTEPQAIAFTELAQRLSEDRDELWFLITTQSPHVKSRLEVQLDAQPIPQVMICMFAEDDASFARHWRPDICIWTGGTSHLSLLTEIARTSELMMLADAEIQTLSRGTSLPIPGLRKAVANYFDKIFSIDQMNLTGLQTAVSDSSRVEELGALREGGCPPTCNESELADVTAHLAARPVWLAAACAPSEFDTILRAHERALRSSHRLLLIISPAEEEDGPLIRKLAEARGLTTGLRSEGEDPESEIQVYIADYPEEIGMWYRIAPLCFVGQTLAAGMNPQFLAPAALGSALIFGPRVYGVRSLTDLLEDKGAALRITDAASLAEAVIILLAPDKVARMAHNAWEAITEGAVLLDRLVEISGSVLDGGGIPDANT